MKSVQRMVGLLLVGAGGATAFYWIWRGVMSVMADAGFAQRASFFALAGFGVMSFGAYLMWLGSLHEVKPERYVKLSSAEATAPSSTDDAERIAGRARQ